GRDPETLFGQALVRELRRDARRHRGEGFVQARVFGGCGRGERGEEQEGRSDPIQGCAPRESGALTPALSRGEREKSVRAAAGAGAGGRLPACAGLTAAQARRGARKIFRPRPPTTANGAATIRRIE